MITDKQRQFDYEYEADYKTKSRYSEKQWTNILKSDTFDEDDLALLIDVYASYNHAANLLQLSFDHETEMSDILSRFNALGEKLAAANEIKAETDYNGNDYYWFLFFWGKELPDHILELKMHPELTEAIAGLYPEEEEAYYAFMGDVERSLQTRYSQEDAVWMAAAVLLYEKYYRNPGISADDILLMQYEVQTRAQRIYGQDVNANTITQICNADERGHRYNYLRDLYKYYRVSFPGEFEEDRERPDPETVNYDNYIYSIFGYMTLFDVLDFIEHEYAHLVDPSYVELNSGNGFVRMANFLSRQCGSSYTQGDTSETAVALRALGEDVEETFHMLAESLIKEYPNFSYAGKASWLNPDSKTASSFSDVLEIPSRHHLGASISITTLVDNDALDIEVALNLPDCSDKEAMLDIQEKCNMLTLMTAAPFEVMESASEAFDIKQGPGKIKARVVYPYAELLPMTEENIIGHIGTSLQIFASYYTDLCQNYYPDRADLPDDSAKTDGAAYTSMTDAAGAAGTEGSDTPLNSLAAALGDKLIVKKGAEAPAPAVIYRETAINPETEYIERTLQGYGTSSADSAGQRNPSDSSRSAADSVTGAASGSSAGSKPSDRIMMSSPSEVTVRDTVRAEHKDRKDQSFRLYPKNTLIQGPVKTAKFHEALSTAVGIIEGKDQQTLSIEPISDILSHFKEYEESGRILHISYPDITGDGYEGFIEGFHGALIQEGIFKRFANSCTEGRYVVLMEDVDLNWMHLFGEVSVLLRDNRREGASSETIITLRHSGRTFTLPSNIYIVATCDSLVCEDTIIGAIHHDFFIKQISADSSVLRGMRIEGIALDRLMSVINLRLSYFLGADYQLGEGFFLGNADKEPFISLARVFREQIIPMLTMWLDGDMEKLRYILADNAKSRADYVFFRETPFRDGLFKGTLPDSFDTEMKIYEINEAAFRRPKSYIEIYE